MTRVILMDHSPEQVLAGSALGMSEAVIWTMMLRRLQRRYPPDLYPKLLGVKHDYGHPNWYREKAREEAEQDLLYVPSGSAAATGPSSSERAKAGLASEATA